MRSMVISLGSFAWITVPIALFSVVGCGGDGTTSTGTSTSSGSGGAGGGVTTASSTAASTSSSASTGPAVYGPPVPTDAPVYNVKANAMTPIMPGSQAGYGITGDGFGTFQLIWTGNTTPGNPAVAFEGSIWTNSKFSDIVPGCSDHSCTLEADDKLADPIDAMGGGQYIGFKATSTNDLDGLEFYTDQEPIYFDLKYDGQAVPPRVVYIDADANSPANPKKIPFGLTAP